MATYNGRRAPNVSQYIANLNTIPSAADVAAQNDFGNFDDDLALFTNTEFFDFDIHEQASGMPNNINFNVEQGQHGRDAGQEGAKNMGFVNREFTIP